MLDSHLFAANQRPAVDVGLSVSRVGGKAQTVAMRKVSGRVRLDYAQFLELEMFTRFGGLSDNRVKAQITRGERIRTLITQPRFGGRLSPQWPYLWLTKQNALSGCACCPADLVWEFFCQVVFCCCRFLVWSGKAVPRPVACVQVRGARGKVSRDRNASAA